MLKLIEVAEAINIKAAQLNALAIIAQEGNIQELCPSKTDSLLSLMAELSTDISKHTKMLNADQIK